MKMKLLTTNVDIAAVAAFGGLIVSGFCALFFVQHGPRLSVIAFAISLWGFLSLRQQDTPQPKGQRWRKICITTALIILIGGGLLFGAIKRITATQTETVCLHPHSKSHCTLSGDSGQSEPPFNKESRNE